MEPLQRFVALVVFLLSCLLSGPFASPTPAAAYARHDGCDLGRNIFWYRSDAGRNWDTMAVWKRQAVADGVEMDDQPLDYDAEQLVTIDEGLPLEVAVIWIDTPGFLGDSNCSDRRMRVGAQDPNLEEDLWNIARHEMGHLIGAGHAGQYDSMNGDNPPTMATCLGYAHSTNFLEQDAQANWAWLRSSLANRQLNSNIGFEQGTKFWGKSDPSVELTEFTTGGDAGPSYVGWHATSNADYLYQTVRILNGTIDDEYRARVVARSPGSMYETYVRVRIYRQSLNLPFDPSSPNGCAYDNGIVNANGDPSPTGYVLMTSNSVQGIPSTTWTGLNTADPEWQNPPSAEAYDFRSERMAPRSTSRPATTARSTSTTSGENHVRRNAALTWMLAAGIFTTGCARPSAAPAAEFGACSLDDVESSAFATPENRLADVSGWLEVRPPVPAIDRPRMDGVHTVPLPIMARSVSPSKGDADASQVNVLMHDSFLPGIQWAIDTGGHAFVGVRHQGGKDLDLAALVLVQGSDGSYFFAGDCQDLALTEPLKELLGAEFARTMSDLVGSPDPVAVLRAAVGGTEPVGPSTPDVPVLNPDDVGEKILGDLGSVTLAITIPEAWTSRATLCTKIAAGWNDCLSLESDLSKPVVLDAYFDESKTIEIWLLDADATLASPIQLLASVNLGQVPKEILLHESGALVPVELDGDMVVADDASATRVVSPTASILEAKTWEELLLSPEQLKEMTGETLDEVGGPPDA